MGIEAREDERCLGMSTHPSMKEPIPKPKWKRWLWLAVRIYTTVCALLVTCSIGLWAWCTIFPGTIGTAFSGSSRREVFLASLSTYRVSEYPRREHYFLSL